MLAKLQQRLARDEQGFTLIELLVVIIIIGILLAIAIPSYLSFRSRANKSAAQANVRAAVPAVEAYYADNNNHAALSLSILQASDVQGVMNVTITGTAAATFYCLPSTVGSEDWYKSGPGDDIAKSRCDSRSTRMFY